MRFMRGPRRLAVLCGAASTCLSACLYFLDLGSTISALVTYYFYQYKCPAAAVLPTFPPLRHDPICRIIRSNPDLYDISIEFWVCVFALLLAHFIYAFMFWSSLPTHQRPFRLAFFMPLIHLHRLLQLFRHGFSLRALEELQRGQREVTSLYNALTVAMETFPQFVIQALLAARLGDSITGSEGVRVQAERIPTTLVLSLVASLVSGFFSSGMAGALLMEVNVPLSKRVRVACLVGCQTVALMVLRAMNAAALAQIFKGIPNGVFISLIIDFIFVWILIGFLYQSYSDHPHSKICFKIVHSFALALYFRFISPIYMHLKKETSSCLLILWTVAHILADLARTMFVLLPPSFLREQESPCHSLNIARSDERWNMYLTCKVFLGAVTSTLFAIFFITFLFMWLMRNESSANHAVVRSSSNTHIVLPPSFSLIDTSLSNKVSFRSFHKMREASLFRLILVLLTILCIQILQRICVIKRKLNMYP